MKKIGIITTNNAINYGAVLQAYSLKEALNSLPECNAEIINYIGNPYINGRKIYRKNSCIKNILYNIKVLLSFGYRNKRLKLMDEFDMFVHKYLSCSGVFTSLLQIERQIQYDILICGSDQIWNLNLMDDQVYFLNFATQLCNPVRCSYAASVAEEMNADQEQVLVKRLKDFQNISVREKKMAVNMEQLLGRKVNYHIDPVFLNDLDFWNIFSNRCKENVDPYILVFFIGREEKDQNIVDRISAHYGLPTRQINLHPVKWVRTDFYFDTLSPNQFVKAVLEAKVVVTDSFHATSFAIIGNVNFYNIKRASRNSRIENLEDILEIPDRFFDENSNGNFDEIAAIDFEKVSKNIQRERMKAFEYFQFICGEKL